MRVSQCPLVTASCGDTMVLETCQAGYPHCVHIKHYQIFSHQFFLFHAKLWPTISKIQKGMNAKPRWQSAWLFNIHFFTPSLTTCKHNLAIHVPWKSHIQCPKQKFWLFFLTQNQNWEIWNCFLDASSCSCCKIHWLLCHKSKGLLLNFTKSIFYEAA